MQLSDLDRRQMLGAATQLAAATPALAAAQPAGPAARPAFTPKQLPFDPKTIAGLSERLLVSHHDNNCVGAVKRLGAITSQVASLDPATAPGLQINGLKREELIAWNSMILHEAYFAGLGPPSRPGGALAAGIEQDFGSETRWRAEFAAMGKALGGGSGWVILTWSHRDRRLANVWAADHTMSLAGGTRSWCSTCTNMPMPWTTEPKAAAYVDAFMATVNWSNADAQFAKAAT
jgi:Fe-Mn family superoxide dismutase